MKFRKKPVVIDAVQWFPFGHPAHQPIEGVSGSLIGLIETLEGQMQVSPGDWVITGVKGEKYPCKPDIFDMTHEPASRKGGKGE